jgi:peptide/nickel transport system permease protein
VVSGRDPERTAFLRFLGRRLVRGLFVIWASITLVFVMAHGAGDPARAMLGPRAQAQQLEAFRRRHGLDRPVFERYARYVAGLVRGDLGRSMRDSQPVAEVIATRLPRTLLLGALALLLELVIGVSIGVVAALRRHGPIDAVAMGLAFLGISAPTFLTGLVFLQMFAYRLGWFPVGGYGVDLLDHMRHALLPAFTLAIVGAATYARIMRSEMIETLRQDYVRTARAKGLPPRAVVRHAFRNALLPIVTLVGLSTPLLVSGALITETVYAWPGIGRLAFESISTGDVPMILGVVLVASIAVQLGNLGADLALAALDPRIRRAAT